MPAHSCKESILSVVLLQDGEDSRGGDGGGTGGGFGPSDCRGGVAGLGVSGGAGGACTCRSLSRESGCHASYSGDSLCALARLAGCGHGSGRRNFSGASAHHHCNRLE